MNVQVLAAVVGGIAGLATGAVASLVAPWVNWGIEKRRLRLQRRRQLVDDWRNGLAEAEINGIFGNEHYQHLLWYQSLRPHLSKQMKKGRRFRYVKKIWYRIHRKSVPQSRAPDSRTVIVSEAGDRIGTAERIAVQIEYLAKKWRLE